MGTICDNIPLLRIESGGSIWPIVVGDDFQLGNCGVPRTLSFIYQNGTGGDIVIDGTEPGSLCGVPKIIDDGSGILGIAQMNCTTGVIPDGQEFSIVVTLDPSLSDSCFNFSTTFEFYPIVPGDAACCTISSNTFAGSVINHLAPTLDLGAQGNADGFLQMTTVVGQTVSKVISFSNNDCVSRTFTITEPACWTGRLDADEDPFTPFAVAVGETKTFIFSYTPTAEEIDCCTFKYKDECETPYEFVVCYEAALADGTVPIDPDPGGGTGGGGAPPCQGVIDCNVKMTTEQLIRAITYKDVNGCPALKIILT